MCFQNCPHVFIHNPSRNNCTCPKPTFPRPHLHPRPLAAGSLRHELDMPPWTGRFTTPLRCSIRWLLQALSTMYRRNELSPPRRPRHLQHFVPRGLRSTTSERPLGCGTKPACEVATEAMKPTPGTSGAQGFCGATPPPRSISLGLLPPRQPPPIPCHRANHHCFDLTGVLHLKRTLCTWCSSSNRGFTPGDMLR